MNNQYNTRVFEFKQLNAENALYNLPIIIKNKERLCIRKYNKNVDHHLKVNIGT